MDFEKTYKEALERAKAGKPLDEVFPELKESENERIRKWLIEMVEELRKANSTNAEHNGNCSKAITYLENQKEKPKTVDSIPPFCVSNVKWADTIITRAIVALSDDVDYNRDEPCKYRREIDDLKKLRDVLCGQKEQKPAEWSKQDEMNLYNIIEAIKYTFDVSEGSSGSRLISWLKFRLFHHHHWKPSEDEERLINTSISFLKDFADKGYENAVECIDWLKSKLNGNSGK